MDPFSLLDAFLKGANDPACSTSQVLQEDDQQTSWDDSFNFGSTKTKRKTKKSNVVEDDAEIIPGLNTKSELVPRKGQKTVYKRLNKINDLLKVPDDEINKKPTTRKHQRKRPPPRQYYSSSDDDMFESDRQAGATMPAIVNLDSDDENAGMPISINRNFASELTALPMTENEEIKMIVKFGLELDEYMLRPYQKLSDLISQIAVRKSITAENIFLMLNDKIVSPTCTLRSIDYIPGLVISAHASKSNANENISSKRKTKNNDEFEFRIQSDGRKHPFVVTVCKFDKIGCLVFQCAEEFKCDSKKIRLEFDGELLDSNKSAEDNGLEDGEMIDMFILKS